MGEAWYSIEAFFRFCMDVMGVFRGGNDEAPTRPKQLFMSAKPSRFYRGVLLWAITALRFAYFNKKMIGKSNTVIVNGGVNSATVVRLHIPAFKKICVERTGSHI